MLDNLFNFLKIFSVEIRKVRANNAVGFPNMSELFRHIHLSDELAIDFIAVFSRMEYALKSTEFANGGAGQVTPAWHRFAVNINDDFNALNDDELAEASTYLLTKPPRKQVLGDNGLEFREFGVNQNNCRAQQLIEQVFTVRNNLFHGGKYAPNGETEEGRNEKLAYSSLIILKKFYPLHANVKSSYEQ